METFYFCQVSWSSEDIDLFEWAFGEAMVKDKSVSVPRFRTLHHKKLTAPYDCPSGRGAELGVTPLHPHWRVSKSLGLFSSLVLGTRDTLGVLQGSLHLEFCVILTKPPRI